MFNLFPLVSKHDVFVLVMVALGTIGCFKIVNFLNSFKLLLFASPKGFYPRVVG